MSGSSDIGSQIKTDIGDALQLLAQLHKKNEGWICPSNPVEKKYLDNEVIIRLESLLCFLLVANCGLEIDKNSNGIGLDHIRVQVENEISRISKMDSLTGHPYIKVEDMNQKELGFLDGYCMAISCMIFYSRLFGSPVSRSKINHFQTVFNKCLEFIIGCAIKNSSDSFTGFFCTNHHLPDLPYKYCTWMVVETMSDFFDEKDYRDLFFITDESQDKIDIIMGKIIPDITSNYIRIYVNESLNEEEKIHIDGRNVLVTERVIQEDEYDSTPQQNVWVLLVLLISGYDNFDVVHESIFMLYKKYLKQPDKRVDSLRERTKIKFYNENLPFKEDEPFTNAMVDRAFLPQFLKVCALARKKFGSADGQLDELIRNSIEWISANRIQGLALWDKEADKNGGWAVYSSERVFEAYTNVLRCYDLHKERNKPSQRAQVSDVFVNGGISLVIENLPLQDYIEEKINFAIEKHIEKLRNEIEDKKYKEDFSEMKRKLTDNL